MTSFATGQATDTENCTFRSFERRKKKDGLSFMPSDHSGRFAYDSLISRDR